MKEKRNILLTFDYELFLGRRSGTVQNCLIIPTASVLRILKKNKIKSAIFFLDTVWFRRIQAEASCDEDVSKVREQLVQIIRDGHYVFPHIHPHWIDARFDKSTGQWMLGDISKYRFSNVDREV